MINLFRLHYLTLFSEKKKEDEPWTARKKNRVKSRNHDIPNDSYLWVCISKALNLTLEGVKVKNESW